MSEPFYKRVLTKYHLKVIILTADYGPNAWSGIGAAVESQAKALVLSGIEVDVFIASPGQL